MPDPCPICQRPTIPEFRPFCSRRCADADLGRWFTEQYRVPIAPTEEPDEQAEPDPTNPAA